MKKLNKSPFMNKGPRNLLVAVAILFGLLVGLHKVVEYTSNTKVLRYSTFLKAVENNEVKEVLVTGQDAQGILKDGSHFEVVIPPQQDTFWEMLKKHGVKFSVGNPANQFSFWYFLPLLSLLITGWIIWQFFRQSRGSQGSGGGGPSGMFGMGRSRAKMFMPKTVQTKFDSVAGVAEAKEELKDIVDFLKHPEKYKRLGAKITRGILLAGAPGNGKTMLARAVAGEADCPFFTVSGSDFLEMFVGVGAARVRDLFMQARKNAPSIIFIDEIDAVGRHRGTGIGGGHDEREQTLNQLLTEMDGFQVNEKPVIVMAATNRPDILDKALLRPGRFDRRVDVPYPDLKSRKQILDIHAKNVKLDSSVELEKIARGTPGFSGADLANLINEAAIKATKENKPAVTIEDFEEARDKVLLGKESKSIALTEEDKKITAYHEAGHALVRLMLPDVMDPLHKVTIIPRGRALGVTHSMPEREKYTTTKDEMLASIMAALGGRIAEEMIFNKLTTGAYSDFRAATNIARDMVCKHGMSDDLGPIVYSQERGEYVYSDKTGERIDQEVKRITKTCYDKAKELLQSNRDKLEKLSQRLLEKETLYAKDIYELLGIEPRTEHRFT